MNRVVRAGGQNGEGASGNFIWGITGSFGGLPFVEVNYTIDVRAR